MSSLKHILRRTNNTPSNATSSRDSPRPRTSDGRQRDDDKSADEKSVAPSGSEAPTRLDTNDTVAGAESRKELKKGGKAVSFLSRLMGGAKKKDADESVPDDESTSSDSRPEGNDAQVFTQSVDNIGFSPKHPHPPAYIKVRAKHKKERDFDRLFLAQELQCKRTGNMPRRNSSNKLRRKSSATTEASNTVWAMEFSRDGKYLAAAGADMIVRVWAVLGSSEDRSKHERQESKESEAKGVDAHSEHLSAPVFQSKPIREYEGHSSTILDLSWSKNNFLLSSSMDKTVRLWHVSRSECLCTFKHNDFVPSIKFHPKDDRFFLAGSLDSKLRLWSIPDKSVAFAAQMPDMITAVAFTPDGKTAMAGCLNGITMFFETEGLKYQTQIHVRSTRGQNAKGSKITGIQAFGSSGGEVKVLITSNDSRIRLYNLRDKSLELKFRGNENNCSQIRAGLSDDGRYIVCGSEDKKAYIWSLHESYGEKRDKTPVEMFDAHNTIVTAVCVAPTKTRQHLSKSEDPVYDLCNPPPVTLLSHAERAESVRSGSRPPSQSGSIQPTPSEFERPREPASYINRTGHKDGNIIVTADFTGRIKVFRQDCAWAKRAKDDDRASLFSKRGSKAGRAASLRTKSSLTSLREPRRSTSTINGSDKILSWRQGLSSTPSIAESKHSKTYHAPARSSTVDSSRSISPEMSMESRRGRTIDAARPSSTRSTQPHPLAADVMIRSPSPMKKGKTNESDLPPDSPLSASRRKEQENPLSIDQGGRSGLFWDSKVWEEHAERINQIHQAQGSRPQHSPTRSTNETTSDGDRDHLAIRPKISKVPSYVSKLSDEMTSEEEEDEHFDDARENGDDYDMR